MITAQRDTGFARVTGQRMWRGNTSGERRVRIYSEEKVEAHRDQRLESPN